MRDIPPRIRIYWLANKSLIRTQTKQFNDKKTIGHNHNHNYQHIEKNWACEFKYLTFRILFVYYYMFYRIFYVANYIICRIAPFTFHIHFRGHFAV